VIKLHKFAHLSDCHLGAHKVPVLQQLGLEAFESALDLCLEKSVDFIIISGDLFDSNLPDLQVVSEAARKMSKVKDSGIPIYVIYGSHDYSPNYSSIVDVLDGTGLYKKIVKGTEGDRLKLDFRIEPNTGAKLVGLSARKVGIERNNFEILDRENLEKEEGFKIFVFHSAISELLPENLAKAEAIPASLLPKGFNYYAGGHVHQHSENSLPGYGLIVYPGTTFASDQRDLELSAKGEKRGFYIVSFSEKVEHVDFIEVSVCEQTYIEYDASNKNSIEARNEIMKKLEDEDVEGKIVLLKIKGELSGGKTSDIKPALLEELLMQRGAKHVITNRHGLTSKEYSTIKVAGETIQDIERRVLEENIGKVKVSEDILKGDMGVKVALELLRVLRQEKKPNEKSTDYETRILESVEEALKLKEALSDDN